MTSLLEHSDSHQLKGRLAPQQISSPNTFLRTRLLKHQKNEASKNQDWPESMRTFSFVTLALFPWGSLKKLLMNFFWWIFLMNFLDEFFDEFFWWIFLTNYFDEFFDEVFWRGVLMFINDFFLTNFLMNFIFDDFFDDIFEDFFWRIFWRIFF